MRVRIVGTNLPGIRFGGREPVHVGVQRRKEVVDLVPGDAAEAVFDFDVDVVDGPDFRGPYVHGKRGQRFLYLSWGYASDGGGTDFEMFRRAKLHLSAIDDGLVGEAAAGGGVLEGRLSLTDGRGGPRCASVRPPLVEWRVRDN
jgi:hypothetical protein